MPSFASKPLFSESKTIELFYSNARSIKRKTHLLSFIKSLGYHVILLSETWLTSDDADAFLMGSLGDYVAFRKDRITNAEITRGGGVAILCSPLLNPILFATFSSDGIECLVINIHFPSNRKTLSSIRICLIYRSPSCPASSLTLLLSFIEPLISNLPFLICGDLNFPSIDWNRLTSPSQNDFLSFVCDHRLTQFVDFKTRGENLLDLVLCNENIVRNVTPSLPFADHTNWESNNSLLSSHDWTLTLSCLDTENAFSYFSEFCNSLLCCGKSQGRFPPRMEKVAKGGNENFVRIEVSRRLPSKKKSTMVRLKDLNADEDDEIRVYEERKSSVDDKEKRKLFSLVKLEPVLWDFRSQKYKKGTTQRKRTWASIDHALCLEDGTASKAFKAACAARKRAKSAIKDTPSGSGKSMTVKEIEYDEELSFLDEVEMESTLNSDSAVEDIDDPSQPSIKKEFSSGSRELLRAMGESTDGKSVTSGRKKKKKCDVQDSIMVSIQKTDEMLNAIMGKIDKDEKSKDEDPVECSKFKYSDLTSRIVTFLDSLPMNTRYRALGAIHNSLNEIEDRFSSSTNPTPQPPPVHYQPYYCPPPAPNFFPYPPPNHYNNTALESFVPKSSLSPFSHYPKHLRILYGKSQRASSFAPNSMRAVSLAKRFERALRVHSERVESRVIDSKNPKAFYSLCKTRLNSSKSAPPGIIDLNGAYLLTNKDKALVFSQYFASVSTLPLQAPLRSFSPSSTIPLFDLPSISPAQILASIASLAPKCNFSPDGLPNIFYSKCKFSIVSPLLIIFNKSLHSKSIPSLWKQAIVKPIPKTSSNSINTFRPISLTCSVTKIFEKILISEITSYLDNLGVTMQSSLKFNDHISRIVSKARAKDVIFADPIRYA
ncbi:hypothetical protein PRIPAC_75771 [Pristionchus pacificus]|uniref:Myb/SANT-like transcription factor n=1 Tax=Pristionchus pacificus TaxID=54126 RepID=A0A2A6BZL3_PRIPA|nr:hypothetical protein PRIPAC_75771 [Pristionchus pacificus]|eukprot:PDM71384.1 Myb/SANT-like transcription factor [Pristionchus pacificus]